jgi:hypothetical protein
MFSLRDLFVGVATAAVCMWIAVSNIRGLSGPTFGVQLFVLAWISACFGLDPPRLRILWLPALVIWWALALKGIYTLLNAGN